MTVAMRIMISSEEIQTKVKELGEKINAHYAQSDKELVLIGFTAWLSHFYGRFMPFNRKTTRTRFYDCV